MRIIARRNALILGLAAVLSLSAPGPSQAAAGTISPKTVGTDPAGDWGQYSGAPEGPGPSGMDLLRASIAPGEDQTIEFMLDVTSFPPPENGTGSIVYEWYFSVGDKAFAIYGPCMGHPYGNCESQTDPLAFVVTDFSRQEACSGIDPIGTTCSSSIIGIARLGEYEGAGQIIFPIPRWFLGARRNAVVVPRPATLHDPKAAVVAHTFYFSNAAELVGQPGTPRDVLHVKRNYRVP